MKETFRRVLSIQTSSRHKELTLGGRQLYCDHVAELKRQLRLYGINPFGSGKPNSFSTGIEISSDIVEDMIKCNDIGNKQYVKFVKERLIDGSKCFFDAIPRNKLNTGIQAKKRNMLPNH